jgi:drug/metabolite transporter (DMT)-like permease
MIKKSMSANLMMLLAAAIWGAAFVAQKESLDYIGPFYFNAIRFFLGGLVLIPLIWFRRSRKGQPTGGSPIVWKTSLKPGILIGVILFGGATLQQLGLRWTTAGKAAFITGLYVVLVPVLGVFIKKKIGSLTIGGVILAMAGLFLLSASEKLTVVQGDLLELAGAFIWAVHVLLIDRFSKTVEPLVLAFLQFMTCAILSAMVALPAESIQIASLALAAIPILYAGVLSVGIAYTLQVVAQKQAEPTQAAIILSLESVFAVLGGWIILGENPGLRGAVGCVLMFAAMLLPNLSRSRSTI